MPVVFKPGMGIAVHFARNYLITTTITTMDEDLLSFSREQLVAEVLKLRTGIREHRDSTGHELCWHHPKLWDLLPEKTEPAIAIPAWPDFMQGCIRYRRSLDTQGTDQ